MTYVFSRNLTYGFINKMTNGFWKIITNDWLKTPTSGFKRNMTYGFSKEMTHGFLSKTTYGLLNKMPNVWFKNMTYGFLNENQLGIIWESYGNHLGMIWDSFGHLEVTWRSGVIWDWCGVGGSDTIKCPLAYISGYSWSSLTRSSFCVASEAIGLWRLPRNTLVPAWELFDFRFHNSATKPSRKVVADWSTHVSSFSVQKWNQYLIHSNIVK